MRPRARRSTLRISLALLLCAALLLMPHVFVVSEAALGQRPTRGAPPPRPGKPEGTFPNLDEVRSESRTAREPLAPIPSTIRSPKLPLQPWNGRRIFTVRLRIELTFYILRVLASLVRSSGGKFQRMSSFGFISGQSIQFVLKR